MGWLTRSLAFRRKHKDREDERTGQASGWTKLPAELRLQVLEEVDLLVDHEPRTKRSALATVCSEWQAFFERSSFRRLQLSSDEDIRSLGLIVQNGRQSYVKSIWLHVSLQRHSNSRSPCNTGIQQKGWRTRNDNRIFTKYLIGLLAILSEWQYDSSKLRSSSGLQLRLSAGCPNEFTDVVKYNNTRYSRPLPCENTMRTIRKQDQCVKKSEKHESESPRC